MNPPPYYQFQIQTVTTQPQNIYPLYGGFQFQAPVPDISIFPPEGAIVGLLDCLLNQSELYIKQPRKTFFGPDFLQILNENREPILSVCIQTKFQGGRGTGQKASISRTFIVSDLNGRVVLQFVEQGGAQVYSGGLYLGVIQKSKCCSTDIVATATGQQIYTARGRSANRLCPFSIPSFDIDCNGENVGQLIRTKPGLLKICIPQEMEVRSKGLLLSLALSGYVEYFAQTCGCTSGDAGQRMLIYYFFLLLCIASTISICLISELSPSPTRRRRNGGLHFNRTQS